MRKFAAIAVAVVLGTVGANARAADLRIGLGDEITDQAFIPLHFQVDIWAMKRDVTYKARGDEHTLAQEFRPAT